MTVCYYHVTYAFQSESALHSYLIKWQQPDSIECRFILKRVRDIIITCSLRFTLKGVRDMIIIYSQMHRTDKNSQYNSIISPVWLNG